MLLVTVVAMATICVGGALGIGGSSPAFADTVIDGCTIVSNPTQTHFTSCPGANLSGADLSGLDLSFADFSGASFVGNCALAPFPTCASADLTSAELTDADLANANFVSCINVRPFPEFCGSGTLPDADLTGANLTASNLVGANLTGATLTSAVLKDVSLVGANLAGANLTDADLTNTLFYGCLSLGGCLGATLTGAILTGTLLIPSDQTVGAMTSAGSVVTWPTPASLPGATPGPCTPPSGSTFPIGTTTVTCTVTDTGGDEATGTFQVVVQAPLSITTISLPPATIGEPYSAQLTASGGNPPYIWHLVFASERLPWHLTLDRLTGVISGVPNKDSATTTFTVRVFDTPLPTHPHRRDTATATFTLVVSP